MNQVFSFPDQEKMLSEEHKDIGRGIRAKELLDNPLLKEAFDKLEASYLDAWRASAVRDTDGRERVFHALNVLGSVRSHLERVVIDGRVAQRSLDEIVARETAAARRK